ncbi:hypothetical protein UACE39S_02727 [Ureibacillus acetophenoni]
MEAWLIIIIFIVFIIYRMMPSKGIKSITSEELKGCISQVKIEPFIN